VAKKQKGGKTMNVAKREEQIIKLNEERLKLIKKVKSGKYPEYEQKYVKSIEQINREIEGLIQWKTL
jgi:hypothetical protein